MSDWGVYLAWELVSHVTHGQGVTPLWNIPETHINWIIPHNLDIWSIMLYPLHYWSAINISWKNMQAAQIKDLKNSVLQINLLHFLTLSWQGPCGWLRKSLCQKFHPNIARVFHINDPLWEVTHLINPNICMEDMAVNYWKQNTSGVAEHISMEQIKA